MNSLKQVYQDQITFWKDREAFEKQMAKTATKNAAHHRRYWKKIEKQMEKLK